MRVREEGSGERGEDEGEGECVVGVRLDSRMGVVGVLGCGSGWGLTLAQGYRKGVHRRKGTIRGSGEG